MTENSRFIDENGAVKLDELNEAAKEAMKSGTDEEQASIAKTMLQVFQKAELSIWTGSSGSVSMQFLEAESKKDSDVARELARIKEDKAKEYEQARKQDLEAMQAEGLTEDDLRDYSKESQSSCIFGDTSYNLDNAIDRMKKRFEDIVNRIDSLEHGRYSRLTMVKAEIAMGLYLIHTEKLYLASSYQSVFEVSKDILKFSRVTTSNYIRVAKRFIQKKRPVSIFYDGKAGIDFNISQLVQLLKLSDDEIRFCMETGMLSYTSSITSIKSLIKAVKERKEREEEAEAKAEAEAERGPFQAAYDSFHEAYNILKAHLLETGDEYAANELLPKIMDSVCVVYAEGLQHMTDK